MQKYSNIYTVRNLVDLATLFRYKGDKDRLVIFDIDDTLIKVNDYMATGIWYKETYENLVARGCSPAEAKFTLLQTHITALYRTSVQLADENIPAYLDLLHKQQHPTICLTAREGRCLLYATLRHLDDVHITFPPVIEPFKKTLFFPEFPEHDIIYSRGILFTGGADKGTVLELFFNKTGYHPREIIFVDDSLGNVESVGSCAQKMGIAFTGFHLSPVEETIPTLHAPLTTITIDKR